MLGPLVMMTPLFICDTVDVIAHEPSGQLGLTLKKPLAWLHIPRCGSSFANTLIHHPGICPWLPTNVEMSLEEYPLKDFFHDAFPKDEYCPGGWFPKEIYKDPPGHESIGPVYDQIKGHGIVMLRQPEQRLLSAFHLNPSWALTGLRRDMTAKQFAKVQQGCMVKMLTRANHNKFGVDHVTFGWEGPCVNVFEPSPPSRDEVELAKKRLHEGFQFVGLTEEFDLSVCLFHAMFGGHCQDFEFDNVRTANDDKKDRKSHTNTYDTAELEGFVDHSDRELYEEAKNIFYSNLQSYGISQANCPSVCQHDPAASSFLQASWSEADRSRGNALRGTQALIVPGDMPKGW